eukprot:TRINITY_DN6832_c0_g1_i1.p1 TRINITY_DN6832_c0_g1~~TRINITY_DN6832_c0_g1_i1.p1  ORF type:complete len:461 (-),score=69.07 TRINITY_DN6832_c0_g1_i1:88-1470(-)
MQGPRANVLVLRIGNDYEYLRQDDAEWDRTGNYQKRHQWTLYCKVLQGDAVLIRSVKFILHQSFQPQTYLKTTPPFQTVQTSFGSFTATVEINFYGARSVRHNWTLCFDKRTGGGFYDVPVSAGNYPTLDDAAMPQHLTFGVELELTVPSRSIVRTREQVATYLQSYGIAARVTEYSDKTPRSFWKIVPDASLCCHENDPQCLTFELVSPILQGHDGLDSLERVMSVLNKLQLEVNKSVGFHVHVGRAPFFSLDELRNICANFVKYEAVFDSFVPESRRGVNNKYCQSHQYQFGVLPNRNINEVILNRTSHTKLMSKINPKADRYYKLNLQRILKESPTVEFRQHSGTSNVAKIRAWIIFILRFVENARLVPPDNFAKGRPVSYQRQRMFQWIIKDPVLADVFEKRARDLQAGSSNNTSDEDWWKCGCNRKFSHSGRLAQHQRATGHSYTPACCTKCADH